MTDRYFSRQQRRHLYVSVDGRCERCGLLLGVRWHAHHIIRFADDGVTEITNGMALCQRCHIMEHRHGSKNKTTRMAD